MKNNSEKFLASPALECRAVSLINCRVPMRDGATLSVDVYLPSDRLGKKLPCLMAFSPYGATASRDNSLITKAVENGFATLNVDCRGRFNSGGVLLPWDEGLSLDAYDLLEWVSQQPWCNGNLAMYGGSYCGQTQLACLRSGHPLLSVCAPSAITFNPYTICYAGGVQVLQFITPWHLGVSSRTPKPADSKPYEEALRALPVSSIPELAGLPCQSWQEIASHDGFSGFWERKSSLGDLAHSRAGIFFQGSWFDMLGVDVFQTFNAMRTEVASDKLDSARRFSCLRVGPWAHGVDTIEGEVDYGAQALVTEAEEWDFITSILAGHEPKSALNPGPIQIFVMGRNEWRFENEWPLKRAKNTAIYLSANGLANTAAGQGHLSWSLPDERCTEKDVFIYDPLDPVPSCGGRLVGQGGQRDQTNVEKRSDVLVYTSEPLSDDLEVTGEVSAVLYVSSSAKDTDFTVKLVDVRPDGKPLNVCDGIIRTRFRDGLASPPRLLRPGECVRLEFHVDVTSYCFLKGHRLRVEISSSNFPHFARNTNTGAPASTDANFVIARQTVFHSSLRPSHLLLPVVPN